MDLVRSTPSGIKRATIVTTTYLHMTALNYSNCITEPTFIALYHGQFSKSNISMTALPIIHIASVTCTRNTPRQTGYNDVYDGVELSIYVMYDAPTAYTRVTALKQRIYDGRCLLLSKIDRGISLRLIFTYRFFRECIRHARQACFNLASPTTAFYHRPGALNKDSHYN